MYNNNNNRLFIQEDNLPNTVRPNNTLLYLKKVPVQSNFKTDKFSITLSFIYQKPKKWWPTLDI